MRHHTACYTVVDKYSTTQFDSAVRCTSQQILKLNMHPRKNLKLRKTIMTFFLKSYIYCVNENLKDVINVEFFQDTVISCGI